jgi:hypothetical protein
MRGSRGDTVLATGAPLLQTATSEVCGDAGQQPRREDH